MVARPLALTCLLTATPTPPGHTHLARGLPELSLQELQPHLHAHSCRGAGRGRGWWEGGDSERKIDSS